MGARTYWRAPVPPLGYSDGPTNNTAVLTDISPVPPVTIPAIWELGTRLHITAFGWITTGSTVPTLILGAYLTPLNTAITAGAALAVSNAFSPTSSGTSWPWWLELEGEVRALSNVTTAAAGSIELQGLLFMPATLTTYNAPQAVPATFLLKTVTFTTNVPQNLQIGATFSATTGSPSIACNHLNVELIG